MVSDNISTFMTHLDAKMPSLPLKARTGTTTIVQLLVTRCRIQCEYFLRITLCIGTTLPCEWKQAQTKDMGGSL